MEKTKAISQSQSNLRVESAFLNAPDLGWSKYTRATLAELWFGGRRN